VRLVESCLDKQLIDRRGRKMGRVDGIVLTVAAGARPRVAYVEIGAVARARRLHPTIARWVAAWSRRWGAMRENPYRLSFDRVVVEGVNVLAAVDAEATPALAWERVLRRVIVKRIPGA
jgi:hypothetical protein